MAIDYNLLRVEVDAGAVRANYEFLGGMGGPLWPVVKADAYGHGLERISEELAAAGAETLCVGTAEEGVRLRLSGFGGRVISLLGIGGGADARLLAEHDILPFVFDSGQLREISRAGEEAGRRLPVCLKFDTGMSRLGFMPGEARRVAGELAGLKGARAVTAASHLSSADMPEERDFTLEQGRRFAEVLEVLAEAGLRVEASLANSAATLAYPDLAHDALRPGIALYGGNPFHATEMEHLGGELRPAMSACAPVLQVKDLPGGASVSYGRTFRAESDMRVAVVAAGYADAYSRGLSNKGEVVIKGQRAKICGRVCMQLIMVDVTHVSGVEPGDTAWLLGGPFHNAVSPHELADWWGTITYEVFCLLGMSRREYL
jgi:alanine racemase